VGFLGVEAPKRREREVRGHRGRGGKTASDSCPSSPLKNAFINGNL